MSTMSRAAMLSLEALQEKARAVRLVCLDVDGVLTPGDILLGEGVDLRRFDSRDGVGIKLLQKAGIAVAVISGRSSKAVDARCAELGIKDVYQGSLRKLPALAELMKRQGLEARQVCYVGDDLPDLAPMEAVGLSVAVADACAEVRTSAHVILSKGGGAGAVREAAELILKAQGHWDRFVEELRHPAGE